MKRVVLVALFMAVAMPAGAADETDYYIIKGEGTKSCGTWIQDRKKGGFEGQVTDLTQTAWLAGYLTAYNLWVPGKADIAEGTDIAGLMAWIDNYCAQNPLNNIANAANALIYHLRSR
jgi:hypothetical protein